MAINKVTVAVAMVAWYFIWSVVVLLLIALSLCILLLRTYFKNITKQNLITSEWEKKIIWNEIAWRTLIEIFNAVVFNIFREGFSSFLACLWKLQAFVGRTLSLHSSQGIMDGINHALNMNL